MPSLGKTSCHLLISSLLKHLHGSDVTSTEVQTLRLNVFRAVDVFCSRLV